MRVTSGLGSLSNQTRLVGEGEVSFLERECLICEVEFIRYEESVWMKVRGERGRSAGCVYMPTDSTSVAVVESCYGRLKENVVRERSGSATW